MRVQIIYGEDFTPRQDEVLDEVCRMMIESGIDLEQIDWSGLPLPSKRPRK